MSTHDHPEAAAAGAPYNCGACSSQEVRALLCELFDPQLSAQRAEQIRARMAECVGCSQQLADEELVREILRNCARSQPAPEQLRQRISVRIRSTTIYGH